MGKPADLSALAAHVHYRIADLLRGRGPGASLPGEIELAARCGVSRTTVRRALQKMEKGGLVSSSRGRRTLARKIHAKDFPPQSVAPVSRDRQVVRYVLDQIGSGEVKPGDALSEKKIAAALGFSTGTVREGLLLLAPMGLFRKRARRQWEAVAFTPEQWEQVMELRSLVEEYCLKKLIRKDRATYRSFIERHLRRTRKLSNRVRVDRNELRELDTQFHQWILDSADNPVIAERHRFIYLLIEFQLRNCRFTDERARVGIEEHIAIMNAILARDTRAAVAGLRKHLASALETLQDLSRASDREVAGQPRRRR